MRSQVELFPVAVLVCQARLLTEGEDAIPIPDKSRKPPEVVDKNQGGQRIKSGEETVVLMELGNIIFFSLTA